MLNLARPRRRSLPQCHEIFRQARISMIKKIGLLLTGQRRDTGLWCYDGLSQSGNCIFLSVMLSWVSPFSSPCGRVSR